MSDYQKRKEKARQEAIDWQRKLENKDYSWGDLEFYGNYFKWLGKKYGLLKEFRENGIC